MDRRAYLRGVAGGGVASALAGCLAGSDGQSSPHTYLDRPESQRADSADLPYPAWGQELPSATLPAPLADETVTTTQFTGQRNVLLTFFYSHCPNVCQQMIGQMRNVQADAIEEGYADEVAFLAVTFDPERDAPQRLETYAEQKHVALDAGNWYFLRPESAERAEAVVTETFGIEFQKTDANGDPVENGSGSGNGTDSTDYYFTHLGLVLLVDVDGYVERAYQFAKSGNPPWQDRRDDLQRVIEREE
ncbi:MAG: SCO family protein [Halobacteriaceae archaeon]